MHCKLFYFLFLSVVDHGNYDAIGKWCTTLKKILMNKPLVCTVMSLPELKCNGSGFPKEIIGQEKTKKSGSQ